jgi:hypothetical protein
MMCVKGSSPGFSSNLDMSDGNLIVMVGHNKFRRMGSFFNRDNSGKSNVINGKNVHKSCNYLES